MADLIHESDSLNTGRLKLNKSIEQSERAENKANSTHELLGSILIEENEEWVDLDE